MGKRTNDPLERTRGGTGGVSVATMGKLDVAVWEKQGEGQHAD